ncbi:MAG: patatin-like phospholipase family protein [Cyclobacteriaceae bacterium]
MKKDTFEIGLCMAGAVSAGAYTAGVVDYLIEALEEWEKKRGQEGVPTHHVIIKAIGGASAGGMTGIIAASALNNAIEPIKTSDPNDLFKPRPENKLYHSWVDLSDDDMFPLMLDNADIEDGKIYSLLNSNFIDEISKKAMLVDKENWIERKYVDNNMKFFTTFTNLEGLKYNTKFRGNQIFDDYLISRHNDYGAFVLNTSQTGYKDDGWIPVDFQNDVNLDLVRHASMATGAFPVGLRSRKIKRDKSYVNDHKWHKDITSRNPVSDIPYEALIVDGGTINNEPFERVKELLSGVDKNHEKCSSTVMMIDPFPSEAEKFDVDDDGLFQVIGATLSAMLGHLRTKPEVLEEALEDDDASQFLVAPRRKINGEWKEGSRAIACGFLGGFGGFIHKEFRIHDYFLGRANCERFLREHFTVPIDTSNPIFVDGYKDIPKDQFVSADGKWRQIIPIFTPKKNEMYMPDFSGGSNWPVRNEKDVDRFKKLIKKRAGKVIMNMVDYSWKQRLLLSIGNWVVIKGKLANAVLGTIKSSMKEHKLLK